MNLGSLWLHMCHERFVLSAVCQMHYLTSLVLQPTLPHHHRIRVGLCWAQLSSQCREILNKCFQCSDNQTKYLWGSQVFRQKDCYAKSEPCYFTKGQKNKKRLGHIVPLAGSHSTLDTGHILMSVFDHKHLVLEASAVCVILRDGTANLKFKFS